MSPTLIEELDHHRGCCESLPCKLKQQPANQQTKNQIGGGKDYLGINLVGTAN